MLLTVGCPRLLPFSPSDGVAQVVCCASGPVAAVDAYGLHAQGLAAGTERLPLPQGSTSHTL